MEGKTYCYKLTRRGNSVTWVRNAAFRQCADRLKPSRLELACLKVEGSLLLALSGRRLGGRACLLCLSFQTSICSATVSASSTSISRSALILQAFLSCAVERRLDQRHSHWVQRQRPSC